ncbi:MAG TPA: hypothetical protein VL357_12245 [Rariglobus sp.]|jgi:hypothetical protein|nr:hypothetical protein [Rariglobus sp.]
MTLTDRRILLFPLLIIIGALISKNLHSSLPILIAFEIGFVGMFFMRTPEQKKIVSSRILIATMVLLIVGIALALYSHR